jgi:DNA-binding transcriptional LysR family regulator
MRTSRSLNLPEAGRNFYESAVRLMQDFEAATSRIGRGQMSPSGVIRVTAAHAFSRLHIIPHLPAFFARYPDITVEMLVSERTSNLVQKGIDLAIRNGNPTDPATSHAGSEACRRFSSPRTTTWPDVANRSRRAIATSMRA